MHAKELEKNIIKCKLSSFHIHTFGHCYCWQFNNILMDNFHNWLLSQMHKNTPIGDLARDVNQDQFAQDVPSNFESWQAHLEKKYASEAALLTLKKAWKKFEKLQTT